jgi:Ca-activated chloride channel homolog
MSAIKQVSPLGFSSAEGAFRSSLGHRPRGKGAPPRLPGIEIPGYVCAAVADATLQGGKARNGSWRRAATAAQNVAGDFNPRLESRPQLVLLGLILLLLTLPALADPPPAPANDPAAPALATQHAGWLEAVEMLISPQEKATFLALREGYQRDAFIKRFWKVRDPFPRTRQNELQDVWETRAEIARRKYTSLASRTAQMLLVFGEPTRTVDVACILLSERLELWFYDRGNERINEPFAIVFRGLGARQRLWRPFDGLRDLVDRVSSFDRRDEQILALLGDGCARGSEIVAAAFVALDVDLLLEKGLLPRPNDEWLKTFVARSTELGDDTQPLNAELIFEFPGRNQSRTVVQGLVGVPRAELVPSEVGGRRFYNVAIDGEVLRQGELFDQFHYRFDFPEAGAPETIPLVAQRYLRPGPYKLILKVEDVNSKKALRRELDLEVPIYQARTAQPPPVTTADTATAAPALPLVATRLDEANASIATGDQTIKIAALPEGLRIGKLRVEARTRGEGIARVTFELDGKPILRKSAPPYSVELNLGDKPRIHRLRAVASGPQDEVLASDEVMLNTGPHRFAVRLVEPQTGKVYEKSLRAHAEVEVPSEEELDRVEFYLNETLMATVYQPPFEQPILLDGAGSLAYVRTVAYLIDGNSAEDVRFINAPDFVDELRVQFVELFTSVVDRKGVPVAGLGAEDFTVFEDGEKQEIRRFESIEDLPIRAGLILDTSMSMEPILDQVEKAAYQFLETVIQPRDRAAIITFNDHPRLATRFTNDKAVLAGGLAGLEAEGETALYDAMIYGLHYFSGLTGKRALVLLTDGEDTKSSFAYEDVIEFARHAGVAVYAIGINLSGKSVETRGKLVTLARETGGEAFFIEGAGQLERIYETIQKELRAQYLIAYQSSQPSNKTGYRQIEIKTKKGLEAKTLRGYYP